MSGLAVVGLVLVAAGVVLLLAALLPWRRRRTAAEAARPKTVADLVRMRSEAGTLPAAPGAPVRAPIATVDPAAPNAGPGAAPVDDPVVPGAGSAAAEAPSPAASAPPVRWEPPRLAEPRVERLAVPGVGATDLFGDDTPWRRAARIGPGDAWVTVPVIPDPAELDAAATQRPERDQDEPTVRLEFEGAAATGPREVRDVREQPRVTEEIADQDRSVERQAREEEPSAPRSAEDRPAPADATAGPDRSEVQPADAVWIDPADVPAPDKGDGAVADEPPTVEVTPPPRSATAWIDPELVARVSRAGPEPPSAGSRPAASSAPPDPVRDQPSNPTSAEQAGADGETTVEPASAGTVPGVAAVAESGPGSAAQAGAGGGAAVEPGSAGVVPGVAAVAEAGPGTAGASATEPNPVTPRRGRPTPSERAAEQAAADLALVRTFGFADPSARPAAAPVVAMLRPDLEEPSRPAEGSAQPVRFHVVRRDGADISGAAVTLLDNAGNEVVTGYAGPDGRGEVLAPAAGSYVLVCTAHDHQPGAAAISVAAAPVEAEVLVTRSASVSGIVQGEDGPIVGARVTLVQDGEIVESIRTDGSGAYCIDDIGPGEYGLSVAAAGCVPAAIMLEVADQFELHHDVALQPATPVVDADEHGFDDEMDEEMSVDIVSGLR